MKLRTKRAALLVVRLARISCTWRSRNGAVGRGADGSERKRSTSRGFGTAGARDFVRAVLQARYLGTKAIFAGSNTSLIPMLDAMLDMAGEHGATECVMAMSHRGA